MQAEPLVDALSSLLKSGKYSDLTIFCGKQKFFVHRAIICPRSKFFSVACDGDFKEAISGEIHLSEDEPHIVARALQYLYTTDYDEDDSDEVSVRLNDNSENSAYSSTDSQKETKGREAQHGQADEHDDGSSLVINALIYVFADRYGVEDLKDLAITKFDNRLITDWNTNSFCKAVDVVYNNTLDGDDLRRLMVQRACEHIHIMRKGEDFNEILKKIPELSVDIVSEMAKLLEQSTVKMKSKESLLEEEHELLVESRTSLSNKTRECNGFERALTTKKRLLVEIRDGLENNDARIAQGVLKISGKIFNERVAKASRD